MTDKLPPNLLALFAPRPPLRFLPPSDHAPEERKTAAISGLASYLPKLQEYKETDVYHPTESWLQKRDNAKLEKKEKQQRLLKDGPTTYKPQDDPQIRGDAFKTLIVARLSYDATEQDLESEFGRFGPLERIRIVVDTNPKPGKKVKKHRGYAFIEFEREKDMRAALDNCDGIRIKDRRIKVDVERGRTVKLWLPRRLGGGLGGRNYTKAPAPRALAAPPAFGQGPNSGFRGGFRGGFDRGRGGGGFSRGGFQNDRGGGRGGIGFQQGGRGYGAAPPFGAPSGPGRGGGGAFGGRGSYDRNGGSGYSGRPSYDDHRGGGSRGYGDRSGSNTEPVRPREYRDRDFSREGGREGSREGGYDSRKRNYEGGYDDEARKRRY